MRAFIIRGFGVKKDTAGRQFDFDAIERELIRPAMQKCNLAGGTTGEIKDPGSIHEDMFGLIIEADVVVCDITVHNANVFYELGVRHALRKKHTVLLKAKGSADTTPFDIGGDRYLAYDADRPQDSVDALVSAIKAGLNSARLTDSPIFQMLPKLAEVQTGDIVVVPPDFAAEVERAIAARSPGWLRLLAEDVQGERFQWHGLRAIARGQWKLKDGEAARRTWEALRRRHPGDVEANLALANIYEREARRKVPLDTGLVQQSNHCLDVVLGDATRSAHESAEALALRARNQKTLWRTGWEALADVSQRRAAALSRKLKDAYEAYAEAFRTDLNNFYPGVAACQMGMILKDLSDLPQWAGLFDDDQDPEVYLKGLASDLPVLMDAVRLSCKAARRRDAETRKWAEISLVDLRFLGLPKPATAQDRQSLCAKYGAAVPEGDDFASDAVRGQLDLFARLDIQPEAAREVITLLDARTRSTPERIHLVVFSGHKTDAPGTPPRFPASAEERARSRIREQLQAFGQERAGTPLKVVLLASAAPGADIIAHEVCRELGIDSVLCLPMPDEVVTREVFANYDSWLGRFHATLRAARNPLVLLDELELPKWLQAKSADAWDRGNRWVLHLADAWPAERKTVLALWDKKDDGSSTGGTAQMVRLARNCGGFEIEHIDVAELRAG